MKPEILNRFNLDPSSGLYVQPWAFNQGFYNLFFAIGLIYSLFLMYTNKKTEGKTLASFILISIVAAGIILYVSAPEKYIASILQAAPALLGYITLKLYRPSKV